MASAMALWIFSSLHKQSWENIRGHNSKNVYGKRGHCDRWFQELKIATWPSESPRGSSPLPWSLLLLMLILPLLNKVFRAWSVWLTCSHSSCLLSLPLSLSPALGPLWLALQVGAFLYLKKLSPVLTLGYVKKMLLCSVCGYWSSTVARKCISLNVGIRQV